MNSERILKVLEKNLKLEIPFRDIKLDDRLETVGLNSLTYIKAVVALEAEFDIEFDIDDLDVATFMTLQDIINYVEKLIELQ